MHENEPHIPRRLEQQLRAGFGGLPGCTGVTPDIDRAVLEMAERVGEAKAARRRRIGMRWRARVALGAAAAVLAGAVTAWFVWPSRVAAPAVNMAQADPRDLNADGLIDMLDALLLAERVSAGGGVDVNGDGREDEADATAIASEAVRLERGVL